MFSLPWSGMPSDIAGWVLAAWFIIHCFFAAGVYNDTKALHLENVRVSRVLFVPPWIWCLTTLLGGPLVAFVYWLMHHSTLQRR